MNFLRHLSNLPGWRTNRKIVVIESDDWGSIRMPSLAVYQELKKQGINVHSGDNNRFNTLDTLASKQDFEQLYATLSAHRDRLGNYPIITALCLSANPDFTQIAESNFEVYFFEPVTATLQKYDRLDAWQMWKQGEKERLFYPEFHGREHLNVRVWMRALKQGDAATIEAFKKRFWGFKPQNQYNISYQAAFDLDERAALPLQKEIIKNGLQLFEQLHGRKARFFVPPNGAIHQEIIDTAVAEGIQYVSTPKIHREPQGNGKFKKKYKFLGTKGALGARYLTRNCFFEPSYHGKGFSTEDCLQQIGAAFALWKPAVISTHRVNYVGGLSPKNAIFGNQELDRLLHNILKYWPDVEFMTSTQLGDLIKND